MILSENSLVILSKGKQEGAGPQTLIRFFYSGQGPIKPLSGPTTVVQNTIHSRVVITVVAVGTKYTKVVPPIPHPLLLAASYVSYYSPVV